MGWEGGTAVFAASWAGVWRILRQPASGTAGVVNRARSQRC